jgi:threonine/homoserine/homoserine lactone efflux protein
MKSLSFEREELIGLMVLLACVVGLALVGRLTDQAVSAIQWVGGAFMGSKGLQGLLPGNKS